MSLAFLPTSSRPQLTGAGGGADQPGDGLEGRGLAGAVGAEQRHDLAGPHFEVDAVEGPMRP